MSYGGNDALDETRLWALNVQLILFLDVGVSSRRLIHNVGSQSYPHCPNVSLTPDPQACLRHRSTRTLHYLMIISPTPFSSSLTLSSPSSSLNFSSIASSLLLLLCKLANWLTFRFPRLELPACTDLVTRDFSVRSDFRVRLDRRELFWLSPFLIHSGRYD